MSLAPRADGLAQADLVRALAHRHQHDVHDDDAADNDADRDDRRNHREQHARELLPEIDERVRRLDGEVVLLARPKVVRDAHRFLCARSLPDRLVRG